MSYQINYINSDATLDNSLYDTYFIDATSNSINLTLVSAEWDGIYFRIIRTDSVSTNTVTLVGISSQLINGAASLTIGTTTNLKVCSANSNWYTIGGPTNYSA